MRLAQLEPFRVLFVDEDAPLGECFASKLEAYGVEVVTAAHGVDALMQYNGYEGHFRAIVIDHKVSGRKGACLARQFQKRGYGGRIILISDGMSLTEFLQYGDCGLRGFFSKPFDAWLLASLLLRDA